MPQHRFRTAVLVGEWRRSHRLACQDAILARQARLDEGVPSKMIWVVPGEIETDRRPHSRFPA
jgi:hypothetical protein